MIDLSGSIPGMDGFFCCYVLRRQKIAMLDIGPSCCLPAVTEGLGQLGIRPQEVEWLLISHIHLDHGGATGSALKTMTNATVVVHPTGRSHMVSPWKLWEASLKTLPDLAGAYGRPEPCDATRMVSAPEGMKVDLGDGELEVLHTPGHAPHHLSFVDQRNSILLAGELCGVAARGIRRPATPPPLYLDQQMDSLSKAARFKCSTLCYGHFGWEDDAGRLLRAHGEQLLKWKAIVARGLRDGQTKDQISQEIVQDDPLMAGLAGLTALERQREMSFVGNAVAGMTGDLQRGGR